MSAYSTHTEAEIASQPDHWIRVADESDGWRDILPADDVEVGVIGCGTSHYMGMAFARLREGAGLPRSEAVVASQLPPRVFGLEIVAISRSGTTTDLLDGLERLRPKSRIVLITAAPNSPAAELAHDVISIEWAAENSIVGTRSATTALAGLRSASGVDIRSVAAEASDHLGRPLPLDPTSFDRFVFLGQGWAEAIAHESALKLREIAGAWSESYSTLEYLHGPISAANDRSVVWVFGDAPPAALEMIRNAGDHVVATQGDAMATIVLVQRLGVELARHNGRDPDNPPHLTASIVLPKPSHNGGQT